MLNVITFQRRLIVFMFLIFSLQLHFYSAQKSSTNDQSSKSASNLPASSDQNKQKAPELKASSAKVTSCFECNSLKDDQCISKPEKYASNCTKTGTKGAVGCWRIEQWVDYDLGPELKAHHRVIRQCAYEDIDKSRSCYFRAGFGGRINACFCDRNLCNSASGLSSSHAFWLALLGALLFFNR